jgi:hypothetical protein
VICELGRGFGVSLAAEGKCWAASAKVSKECTVAGFLDVVRLHYLSSRNSDLRLETESEYTSIIEMLYTACLLRAGEIPDKKAASKRAEELVSLYRSLCADGQSPPVKLMRVVAQKPLLPRLH